MSEAPVLSENGILVAAPPWKLKGRLWQFVTAPLKKDANFPAGWATPCEADVLAKDGEFVGGLGQIMLVQYTESPVGPYDELVYVPGKFQYKDGSLGARVTRIYVSTKESTENGRKNWNIPKRVASFTYKKDPNTSTWDLAVSNLETPDTPFFHITVKPVPILSSLRIPFDSTILGSFGQLIQPPLPKNPDRAECVATEKWVTLTPGMKGKMRLGWLVAEMALDNEERKGKKIADGVSFPAVKPYRLGFCLEDMDLDFGVPEYRDSY